METYSFKDKVNNCQNMSFGNYLNRRRTEMPETVYLMVDSSRGSWNIPGVSEKFKALKIAVKFIKTH
jgi:hypothetical protein